MKAPWDDPVWKAAFLARRAESPAYKNRGPKISQALKAHWDDSNVRERRLTNRMNSGKAVTLDGFTYSSVPEASRLTGLSKHAIKRLLKEQE